jgi:MYXO-CTERM domain-containing protein
MNTPSPFKKMLQLALVLAVPAGAWAADPVAGSAKFSQTCAGCHSVASTATVDRGRNSPAMISNAIANIAQMNAFAGSLSTADRENIAAYLGDSPSALSFAQTTVGQTSAASVITFKSSQFEAISSIAPSVTGDFALQGGTCGTSLPKSSSCTIGVVFKPTAAGSRSGTLSIGHSGMTTPVTIAVSGTAVAAAQATIALDASSLAFGSQVVGAGSATQTINVSNTGAAALSFTSIAVNGANAGDFAVGGTCAVGSAVAAGAKCTVTVGFTPAGAGARSGSLALASNASNGTTSVSLTGTGTAAAAPALSLGASSLAFGSVAVGTSTAAQTVTLTNSGSAALAIQSIQAGGAFTETNDCPASLAAAASCTVSVVFTPSAAGAATGALTVTSNASGSPHSVALSGTGVLTTNAALNWSSAGPIAFGSASVGTEPATQSITLSNTGPGTADLGQFSLAGTNAADFRIDAASTCVAGLALAAGGSCKLVLGFVPSAAGARAATVAVTSNDASVPAALQLAGTGTAPAAPALALSADSLAFVAPATGSAASQTLTLTNSGTADLHVSALAASSARFTVAPAAQSPCGTPPFALAAGSSCSVQVGWIGVAGDAAETATLTVTGDIQPATTTVALHGEGQAVTPANSGGGGCTVGAGTSAVDPLLAGMAVIAAALAWRRRRRTVH